MTHIQAEQLISLLTNKGIQFEKGLSDNEVKEAELLFNFRFPPDLKLFLQASLPVSHNFVKWRLGLTAGNEQDKIFARFAWPLEGMLFDLKENDFWYEPWGAKPDNQEDGILIAKKFFGTYPKLIPVCSHRYIPATSFAEGNPIFSVYQTDIIYYGFDLPNYLSNEFGFPLPDGFEMLDGPKVEVEFWGDMACD